MSKPDPSPSNSFGYRATLRMFFAMRIVFYVVVAFAVRESIPTSQSKPLSSDFEMWASTFPSRLDRAMPTVVAE